MMRVVRNSNDNAATTDDIDENPKLDDHFSVRSDSKRRRASLSTATTNSSSIKSPSHEEEKEEEKEKKEKKKKKQSSKRKSKSSKEGSSKCLSDHFDKEKDKPKKSEKRSSVDGSISGRSKKSKSKSISSRSSRSSTKKERSSSAERRAERREQRKSRTKGTPRKSNSMGLLEGRVNREKRKSLSPKRERSERRAKSIPRKNNSMGLLEGRVNQRRQTILDDLDMLDNQETVTNTFLQNQVKDLEEKVAKLSLEKDFVQVQLEDEIERNGELERAITEQSEQSRRTTRNQEDDKGKEEIKNLKSLHAEEKITWTRTLLEKEQSIDALKKNISEMLANKETTTLSEKEWEVLNVEQEKAANLQEKVEIQKRKIDELTLALSQCNHSDAVAVDDDVKTLIAELDRVKSENARLKTDMQRQKREHEAAMNRKDESIVFFHNELTKLKQTKPSLLSPGPNRPKSNPYLFSSSQQEDEEKIESGRDFQQQGLASSLRQSFTNLTKLVSSPLTTGKEAVTVSASNSALLAPL